MTAGSPAGRAASSGAVALGTVSRGLHWGRRPGRPPGLSLTFAVLGSLPSYIVFQAHRCLPVLL